MLRPLKMQKIRVVAVKSITDSLLQDLHNSGIVEIRKVSSEDFKAGKTAQVYDRISAQWVKLRTIKSMLGLHGGEYNEMDVGQALEEAEKIQIDEPLRKDHDRLSALNSGLAALTLRLRGAKKLLPFKSVDFASANSKYITLHAGTVASIKMPSLRKSLPSSCEVSARVGKTEAVLLVLCKNDEDITSSVELALSKHGFAPINVSDFTNPSDTVKRLEGEIAAKKGEIAKVQEEISAYASKYGEKVKTLERTLAVWAEREMATKEFGFGAETFVLEGWVKDRDYEKLSNHLEAKFNGKVFIDRIAGDKPPTVLDNPASTTQFQFLVELFSLPQPGEIDPSLILLITVPIMYGLMLGDVFYGIISFLLASWMLTKVKKGGLGYGVARIWQSSALAATIFGFIFDEWMGFSHFHILEILQSWGIINIASLGIAGPLYAGLSRMHNVSLLIGLSVILGMIHLAFGFILGAINEWDHSRKHAYGKLAWIGLEIGGFLLVTTYMFNMFAPDFGLVGAALLVPSLLIIVYTEGLVGAVELPGIISNSLSYARIAAVGLAGVVLAELINESFLPTPSQGLLALLMLPIFVLLHVMNAGLAMVESIVQGGRLNLVEFYGKFFHGGGKAFAPFSVEMFKNEVK